MSSLQPDLKSMGEKAKRASRLIGSAGPEQKDKALALLAERLENHTGMILAANALDLREGFAAGLSEAMLDRLSLQGRIQGIAQDVRKIASLPDPVGEVFDESVLPNGLEVAKQRVPIGVLGVIYEARPNVTVDVSALAIKTGNCAILRGGSETLNSNRALVNVIHEALNAAGLPADVIQFIDSSDRGLVKELLLLHDYVDIIIPRGGANLHKFCRENSTIPVITGGIGICHLFVDETADLEKALHVIHNAKTQRPTVCNALDTLLVHEKAASRFIPMVVKSLGKDGVKFKVDSEAMKSLKTSEGAANDVKAANDSMDWDTEWLSLILGIKVVGGLEEAIQHIQSHSSGHSDGIITEDEANARQFVRAIDSAAVYVNASTRFTDGGQLGLGAEVAISTQKLHARGPMGLKELTSYKWVIRGNYHVRK